MKINFNSIFLGALDTLLHDSYDDITTREDFLALLVYIEKMLSKSKHHDMVWFENHALRPLFGRPRINGKRVWKLDLLIKKLIENKS